MAMPPVNVMQRKLVLEVTISSGDCSPFLNLLVLILCQGSVREPGLLLPRSQGSEAPNFVKTFAKVFVDFFNTIATHDPERGAILYPTQKRSSPM